MTSITLDPYVEGEVPEPLLYQFQDSTGTPIDLTDYDATFHLRIGTTAVELTAEVSDEDSGEVTHTWAEGELVRSGGSGALRCEFVVTNGTNTFISELIRGFVRQPVYIEESP